MQSRTTLLEMSKALNLSISTVSKSLSGSTEISLETKKRVNNFAKECNYVPNTFAANLRKGYTNNIGLIIPNILNPFYAKVLLGIEGYLDKKGYKLITSISNESRLKESKSINKMASGYVDGFIICVSKEAQIKDNYSHIESLINLGTPLVLFDRICNILDCDKVIIDNYKTAYDTTLHLIEKKKCTNIILASLIGDLHHGKLRTKGFKEVVGEKNKKIKGKVIVSDTVENLREKIETALKRDKTIDAIFGISEQAVIQAIHVSRHLKTKKDRKNITIAGFCNEHQTDYDASLIVVNQNAEEIGMQTAKLLLKRIKTSNTKGTLTKKINTFLS